jgi:hypothetical protein
MDLSRLNSILSSLDDFKLTQHEKRFLELVKTSFGERGSLTEEQETMLEGVYREKVKWARLGLIPRERTVRGSISREPARFRNKEHLGSLSRHGDV